MRTHEQIILDAGGYKQLAVQLHQKPERLRFWARRKAIPPEEWVTVAEAGVATLDELAQAAAARRAA